MRKRLRELHGSSEWATAPSAFRSRRAIGQKSTIGHYPHWPQPLCALLPTISGATDIGIFGHRVLREIGGRDDSIDALAK